MKDATPNCRAFSGDSAGFYPRPGIFYESPLLPRRPSVMASWADQLCGPPGFPPEAASGGYDRLLAMALCLCHQRHLMRRPPRSSGLQSLGCFYPCSVRLPACQKRKTRSAYSPTLPGASPIRGRAGGCPERPASGPGQHGPPYPGRFSRAGGCAPLSVRGGGSPPRGSLQLFSIEKSEIAPIAVYRS